MKLIFLSWIPFFTTPYLSKAALVTFLFAIFPPTLYQFRRMLWVVTIYCALSFVTSILLLFLICHPLSQHWYVNEYRPLVFHTEHQWAPPRFAKENGCSEIRQKILWNLTWALHFSTDLSSKLYIFPQLFLLIHPSSCHANRSQVFIIPFLVLHTLRLDFKQKVGLFLTFGFGIVSMAFAFIRFLEVLVAYPSVHTTNIGEFIFSFPRGLFH